MRTTAADTRVFNSSRIEMPAMELMTKDEKKKFLWAVLEMCRRTTKKSNYRYLNKYEKNIFHTFMLQLFQKFSSYRYMSKHDMKIVHLFFLLLVQKNSSYRFLSPKEKGKLFPGLVEMCQRTTPKTQYKYLNKYEKRIFHLYLLEIVQHYCKSYKFMRVKERHAVFRGFLEMSKRTSKYNYLRPYEKSVFNVFLLQLAQKFSSYRFMSKTDLRIVHLFFLLLVQKFSSYKFLTPKEKGKLFPALVEMCQRTTPKTQYKYLTKYEKRIFHLYLLELVQHFCKSYKFMRLKERRALF